MGKTHHYQTTIRWQSGEGTRNYQAYQRDFSIAVTGKPDLPGSSDPSFRGDPERYNPEELLLSAIASCHMLWYLHFCAVNGVVVTGYKDQASATMEENAEGSGKFTEVILYPEVRVTNPNMVDKAMQLHQQANKYCFIANSLNFTVTHRPKIMLNNE